MPAQSDESLRFAAERQIPIGAGGGTPEDVAATFDRYREIGEDEFGWTPTDEHFTILSQVYVGEEQEAAREEAKPHLTFLYERLFAGVHIGAQARMMGDDYYDPQRREEYVDAMPPYTQSFVDFDYESAVESGTSVVGDPEHVASRIEEIYEVAAGSPR